jgi:uncharacterized protein (TIGR03000 family)
MVRRFLSTHARAALTAAALLALTPAAEAQPYRVRGGPVRSLLFGGRYGTYQGVPPRGGYSVYYPGSQYGVYQSVYTYTYPAASVVYYQTPVTGYAYPADSATYQPYTTPQYGYGGSYTAPTNGYGQSYTAPARGGVRQDTTAQAGDTPQYPTSTSTAAGETRSFYAPASGAARLTVRLPADAQLWVDGVPLEQSGAVRVIATPPLKPGQTYHYTVKAQWRDNDRAVTREREVDFEAGDSVTVDFTRPAAPPAPPTAPEPIAAPAAPPTPPAVPPG